MEKKFYIHLFCVDSLLCKLFIKYFQNSKYRFDFTIIEELKDNELNNLDISPDCVLINKGIKKEIQDKIKTKFKDLDIIYLPSLKDVDIEIKNGDKQISEPLKLSELENVLDEIFEKKRNE